MRVFIFFTMLFSSIVFAQNEKQEINWVSFEEAVELNKTTPKPIIVDIYATWCGPCKRLNKVTFKNKVIVEYINENFYAVKFNGEQTDSVTYKGKTFLGSNRRTHQFTGYLTNNSGSYPTISFFNKNEELIQAIPGYIPPKAFEPILHFFAEEIYLKQNWSTFTEEFKGKL